MPIKNKIGSTKILLAETLYYTCKNACLIFKKEEQREEALFKINDTCWSVII